MLCDVRLTGSGHICAADLRRLSNCTRVDWVYNKGGVQEIDLQVGAWVMRQFGKKGEFVGRIVRISYPGAGDEEGAMPTYKVVYEDADDEVMSHEAALQHHARFVASGFAQTKGWKRPRAGVRQLRRMDKKLKRRVEADHKKRARWKKRQRSEQSK